jgi:hypothetical protein
MKILASLIKPNANWNAKLANWDTALFYEDELKRLWPINQKEREAKIAQFANEYGFRLRFYSEGLCAIFDEWPRRKRRL